MMWKMLRGNKVVQCANAQMFALTLSVRSYETMYFNISDISSKFFVEVAPTPPKIAADRVDEFAHSMI